MANRRKPPAGPDGGPATPLIDHGHRTDCGFCEGEPVHTPHPYVPPDVPRDKMADIIRAFPGLQVTDAGPPPPPAAAAEEDDPYALPDLSGGIVVPAGRVTGEDLIDRLLCMRPLGNVEVDTDYGPKTGIECYVVEVTPEGHYDHGRLPILWMHVLTELRKANPQSPWVVGRIVKRKTAYFLNPPSPRDAAEAKRQLAGFLEARRSARDAG